MEILESVLGIGLDIILLLYLLKDYKCKFGKNAILCFCVIYLFLVMILNNVLGSSIFRLPIYCSVVWCFIWVFYEEITRKAALKLTALYFVTMQISEMLILGSIVWLGDYDLYEKVVNGNSANTLVIIFISKFMNFLLAALEGRYKNRREKHDIRSIVVLFPLMIALFALAINTTLILNIKDDKSIMMVIFTTSLIIFSSMSYTVFFEYYEKSKEKAELIEKLVLQNKQQYKIFQEKMSNDQKIRKMYHDMKNHILYLRYCFENGHKEKGIEYTSSLLEELSTYNVSLHTGNGILDCLISEMTHKCENSNIVFKIDINLSGECFMNDFDICTLFGNILNNAFEATMRLENCQNKPIILKMSKINDFYVLKETNYMTPSKRRRENIFETSKKDKENHGIGLKNIDEVVEKYGGIKKISVNNDLFTLKIMFPVHTVTKSAL